MALIEMKRGLEIAAQKDDTEAASKSLPRIFGTLLCEALSAYAGAMAEAKLAPFELFRPKRK